MSEKSMHISTGQLSYIWTHENTINTVRRMDTGLDYTHQVQADLWVPWSASWSSPGYTPSVCQFETSGPIKKKTENDFKGLFF